MLHFKDINREAERLEEWPDGRRVTERARERIREVQLNWDSLRALVRALSAFVDGTQLLDFLVRANLLLALHYSPELISILL